MTYNSDQLPCDSDLRDFVALSTAGALCSPEDVIEDWRSCDSDYTQAEQDFHNGVFDGSDRGATIEEIEAYYDSCHSQALDITILKQEDDE